MDANYFGGKMDNNSLITSNYFANNSSVITKTELQKTLGGGRDKNFVIQSDFVEPISKLTKLETRVRAALRSRVNLNDNYLFNDAANDYLIIPSATSDYKKVDNVYADYTTLTHIAANHSQVE